MRVCQPTTHTVRAALTRTRAAPAPFFLQPPAGEGPPPYQGLTMDHEDRAGTAALAGTSEAAKIFFLLWIGLAQAVAVIPVLLVVLWLRMSGS